MMRRSFALVALLALGCGEPADPDAGVANDAGEDGGAAPRDAGAFDAGGEDAGAVDAGVADAGAPDAGPDAGPLVCADGFADCDDVPTDCEVELASDALHCGACGLACGPGQTCTAAACVGPRRVFVTSGTVVPSMLGDLATADAFCQTSAHAVGFAGDYRAWLSAGTESPSTRFSRSAMGYVRVDGTSVATDWADLTDGSLGASPSVDETGAMAPLDCDVLTATWVTGAGRFDAACSNLMGTGRRGGMFGLPGRTDNQFTQGCLATIACNRPARLYCFEQ